MSEKKSISRRQFIKYSMFGVFGFVFGGTLFSVLKNDTETNNLPVKKLRADRPVRNTLTNDQKASCGLTPNVTSGPYYISGTNRLENGDLNYSNFRGEKMEVSGYVYEGVDNSKPLSGAKIEIWQADTDGKYYPQANGDISKFSKDQISLRGYVLTDENGYYKYTSIYPGEYSGRVRHVHYQVSKDGYRSVITQLIFYRQGDKLKPEDDNIAVSLYTCQQFNNLSKSEDIYKANYDFNINSPLVNHLLVGCSPCPGTNSKIEV
jgi:protocatechuate 3,4-dioxygenase beta subunit